MANHQQENSVQNFPSPDSLPTEPFESIVELYCQTQGYITSSNKWFWSWKKGKKGKKKQRGWRDIDVLAINGEETLIIAVTVNLDDKVGNEKKRKALCDYFWRVEDYLKNVKEYRWLRKSPHKVKRVLAYECGYARKETLEKHIRNLEVKMRLIPGNTIFEDLRNYVLKTQDKFPGQNLKTNNPLVMLVRLLLRLEEYKCDRTVNRRN